MKKLEGEARARAIAEWKRGKPSRTPGAPQEPRSPRAPSPEPAESSAPQKGKQGPRSKDPLAGDGARTGPADYAEHEARMERALPAFREALERGGQASLFHTPPRHRDEG
jgi:hypothetical protein